MRLPPRALLVGILALGAPPARALPVQPMALGATKSSSPRGRLGRREGLERARAALSEPTEAAQLRGLAQLAELGTQPSLELLASTLAPGGLAATQPKQRLAAVRALARHAHQPTARAALGRVLGLPMAPEPLVTWARHTAALALAADGHPSSLAVLVRSLAGSTDAAIAAEDALLAFPPTDATALLVGGARPSVPWLRAAAKLGDQRLLEPLREAARRGPLATRVEAALALIALGSTEPAQLAARWSRAGAPPEEQLAAARLWVRLGSPRAAPLLAAALTRPTTRDEALELALEQGHPALVPALLPLLEQHPPSEAAATALAGCGAEGVAALAAAWPRSAAGSAIAYALALAPAPAARRAIARALGAPSTRGLALRAALVRQRALGEPIEGVAAALDALLRDGTPDARAIAAWAGAELDAAACAPLTTSDDPSIIGALARVRACAPVAAARLARAPHTPLSARLAAALLDPSARRRTPTARLLELLDTDRLAAPLAALGLAERDPLDQDARLRELLEHPDASVRAHVALGLARSARAGATGRLAEAYLYEPAAPVRRAIARALAARGGARAAATLELAARLDADPDVRAIAHGGLRGRAELPESEGPGTLWLTLDAARGARSTVGVRLNTAVGWALPASPDPDGVLVQLGLPAGSVSITLARAPHPDEPHP